MTENEFWKIIEKSGSPDKLSVEEQCENITELLSDYSKAELISFSNIQKELLCKAYTWSMLKACMVIIHYVSDDVFEDFRSWVILNGKSRFYSTLNNPDDIAAYIKVNNPVEEVIGESLLYVAEEAWDGDVEELEEKYIYPSEPEIDLDWPSKSVLEMEYPKL